MSLPGVFGALTYEAAGSRVNVLHSAISLSGSPTQLSRVQQFLFSLPGVLGMSWYNVCNGVDKTIKCSVFTSSAESSHPSSTEIPVPGVCGRSHSCTVGDAGLLRTSKSGSLSTTLPVGVTGLRCSTRDSCSPGGPSSSLSRFSSAITDKQIWTNTY